MTRLETMLSDGRRIAVEAPIPEVAAEALEDYRQDEELKIKWGTTDGGKAWLMERNSEMMRILGGKMPLGNRVDE